MVPPTTTPYGSTYNPSWGNHTNSSWELGPPQYTPPAPPYYASTPQLSQPPQLSASIEEAILNLRKLVDTFIEERKAVIVQANQKIDTMESKFDTMESSLYKRIDGFQSEIDQKFDILQNSISRLTKQHIHQEEESRKEECLSDTMVEEHCQQQLEEGLKENFESSDTGSVVCPWEKKEETSPMLIEEGSGKEEMEEPQKPTAQATNSPLSTTPSTDQVYTLPTPATQSTPKTPAAEAKTIPPSLHIQYFRKLVASAQAFATASKILAVANIAWNSGWFGCWFRFGAPEPQQLHQLHQF